jgi:hypothetical protein
MRVVRCAGVLVLIAAASCEPTAPQPVELCGTWLMQHGTTWDTLSSQVSPDDLTPVVTLAKLSGTDIITVTADELVAMSGTPALGCVTAIPGAANRLLHGTIAGMPDGKQFTLKAAGRTSSATATGFDVQVPAGSLDLLAYISEPPSPPTSTFMLPEKMIVRRGVSYADGATIPVFDFASSEAFALESAPLTADLRNNVTGETTQFVSGTTTVDMRRASTSSATLIGLPESQLKAGDYHLLTVTGAGGVSVRTFYRKVAATNVAVPPPAASGVSGVAEATPCTRTRVTIPVQPDYPSFAVVTITWTGPVVGSGKVTMSITKAAAASTALWTMEVPDVGSTCLIPPNATVSHAAVVGRGRLAVFRGAGAGDGEQLITATSVIARP